VPDAHFISRDRLRTDSFTTQSISYSPYSDYTTDQMTEKSWFDSHHWQDFLFSNAFRPNLNPHPGSYSMGIGGPFSEVRWPECNVSHSSWSSGKVKNAWSCTSHLRNGTSL